LGNDIIASFRNGQHIVKWEHKATSQRISENRGVEGRDKSGNGTFYSYRLKFDTPKFFKWDVSWKEQEYGSKDYCFFSFAQ